MSTAYYTEEQLNFFRACHVTTSVIPEALRTLYQCEWDTRYKVAHGQWQDTAKNGKDFYNMESPRNQKRNARLLNIMKSGNRRDWDCTCLFYAILYSDSISVGLNPVVKSSVDDLREFRNGVFAHTVDGNLKEADFQSAIQKVVNAFACLKLDTAAILEIKNQTSFPTEEVISLLNKLAKEQEKTRALEEELNAEPKAFCLLPPKPSHETISRSSEVKKLLEKMKTIREENKNEVTTIYLSGNPGSGKSQVARQIGESFYKARCEQSTDDNFVMTLNAENEEKLLQSYTEFALRLGCTEYSTDSILKSEKTQLAEKIGQLRRLAVPKLQQYSSWLLIVDNVTYLKSVCQHWPQAGETACGNGQVLITTQDMSSISHCDSHISHVSLSVGMKVEDAVIVLSKISGLTSEVEIETNVAKVLDFQPLALACAAVYVRHVREAGQSITWNEYLQKLEEGKREPTEKAYKDTSLSYPNTMTTAVKLALEREIEDNEVMKHAFQYLSLLAPEPLSLDHIVRYVNKFDSDEDEKLVAEKITTSSLTLYSGPESNEVRVHQVVHYCLTHSIFNEDNDPDIDVITAAILTFTTIQSFSETRVRDIRNSQPLLPHISHLVQRINRLWTRNSTKLKEKMKENNNVITCLQQMGNICIVHSCYQTAKESLGIVLDTIIYWCGENKPEVVFILRQLGRNERKQGKYEDAQIYYEKALAIAQTVLGPNHPDTADVLTSLGSTLQGQGLYEEAKKFHERALAIKETVFGPSHRDIPCILHNLGVVHAREGQYEAAKMYCEKALDIFESVFGPDHPDIAATLLTLGNALTQKGQHEAAIECYEKALVINKTVFGANHPDVATTLICLAITLEFKGEYEAARAYFEKALAITETTFGQNHPDVAGTLIDLGNIAQDQGQYEAARKYYARALVIGESVFGPNHPCLATTLNNLGNTLESQGQYEAARKYYGRALVIGESALGPNHPDLAGTLNNLGNYFKTQGQYQTARRYCERALRIGESLGSVHPIVVKIRHNLADTYLILWKTTCGIRYRK